ncbi:MAG TPA: LamG domain-containing protein [Cyclobacteriaceae bacterium]|nr:LamG domain-containing protein [Cyclobacteriaceae bacterium]
MMKSIFLVSIFLLMLSCTASTITQNKSKPSDEGLIAYYKFDGNPSDSKGSNNGSSYRMRYLAFDKRNTQGIAEFDGSNSYINLPNKFDFRDRTISFWVRAKEIPVEGAIIFVSDNPTMQYGLTVFGVKQEGQNRNLVFNFSSQVFTTSIEKGKWYHVAASLQDKSYRYYLNGKLASSGTLVNYTKSGNGHPAAIIGSSRVHDRIFNGSLDDLRIYNRALSDAEIAVLAIP